MKYQFIILPLNEWIGRDEIPLFPTGCGCACGHPKP